ncbi:MAG: hypothetical protein ACOYT8_01580 [Candidatus Dependentiae bacterium]
MFKKIFLFSLLVYSQQNNAMLNSSNNKCGLVQSEEYFSFYSPQDNTLIPLIQRLKNSDEAHDHRYLNLLTFSIIGKRLPLISKL